MKHRRAFTLIELLVVIAIIALLVSILMPSLQKAKQLAKDVVCRSNQKNVSLGIMLYAEEHGGGLPYNVDYSAAYDTELDWTLRVGKVQEDRLPRWFPDSLPKPWAEPNHIVYQICRNGYVDYLSFGDNEIVPYDGPFVCPAFVDQVNPKSRWEGGTSFQFSLNSNCSGGKHKFRVWRMDRNPDDRPRVTQVSDVRAAAVLIGDCNLNPGGNIRVHPWYRTTSRGDLQSRPGIRINDFGPWTHQRAINKWGGDMPCDFYGHSGERANLSFADSHVEAVAEILHKQWRIK